MSALVFHNSQAKKEMKTLQKKKKDSRKMREQKEQKLCFFYGQSEGGRWMEPRRLAHRAFLRHYQFSTFQAE